MSNSTNGTGKIAIIVGTGFTTAFGDSLDAISVETPYGDALIYQSSEFDGNLYILPRHGLAHTVPPHRINFHANIWALDQLGVASILSTAATGSLRDDLFPGEIILIDDFIDFRGTVTTFYNGDDGVVKHTDLSTPFDPELRQAVLDAVAELKGEGEKGLDIHPKGVYVCTSGPRYETASEVRLFAQWGADIVGMTVAPEVILSREANIRYAAIAVVTNLGTGLSGNHLDHSDVSAQMKNKRPHIVQILRKTVSKLFERSGVDLSNLHVK